MKKLGFLVGLAFALCAAFLPAQSFASPLDGFHHQVASATDTDFAIQSSHEFDIAAVNHERPSGLMVELFPPGAAVDPDDSGGLALATSEQGNLHIGGHRHLKSEVGWRG